MINKTREEVHMEDITILKAISIKKNSIKTILVVLISKGDKERANIYRKVYMNKKCCIKEVSYQYKGYSTKGWIEISKKTKQARIDITKVKGVWYNDKYTGRREGYDQIKPVKISDNIFNYVVKKRSRTS